MTTPILAGVTRLKHKKGKPADLSGFIQAGVISICDPVCMQQPRAGKWIWLLRFSLLFSLTLATKHGVPFKS